MFNPLPDRDFRQSVSYGRILPESGPCSSTWRGCRICRGRSPRSEGAGRWISLYFPLLRSLLRALLSVRHAPGTCSGLFGSGWVWLAKDKDGKLSITKEANGSNPVAHGLKPILGFDVWEHAYYLDYRNRRPDHLNALWKIIDWDTVGKRY